ncbi:MAG: START domain-containing protein [Bacteroidota bacterium]
MPKYPLIPLLLMAITGFFHPAFSQDNSSGEWQLAKETDGIRVYLRERGDSPIKEFRAVGQVSASMSSVVALLIDAEAAPDWYNHVKEGRLLSEPARDSHLAYTALSFPWPLSDRDMISKFEYKKDKNTGSVRLQVQSVPDHLPPDDKMIRIKRLEGYWMLTPLDGDVVEVRYQFFADPEGSIPGWLINMFLVEDPITAMKNLRDFVQKPKYQQAEIAFLK